MTDWSIRASFRRLHWHFDAANVLGTGVANTIWASGVNPRKQAGHLIASDRVRNLLAPYKRGAVHICNLYTSKVTGAEIARAFNAQEPAFDFTGDKDHYPKSMAPVVRDASDGRVVDLMRWGFPPPAAARAPVTNVRNLASPFWRTALARPDRRCLVPVTKFCEWEGEAESKVKRWFAIPSRPVFAFAGVWRPTETEPAFAFLTCEPNPIVAPIHPKAMPVILHEEDYDGWLKGEFEQACALATPYPSQLMTVS